MSLSPTRSFLLSVQMDVADLRRITFHSRSRVQEEGILPGSWEGPR